MVNWRNWVRTGVALCLMFGVICVNGIGFAQGSSDVDGCAGKQIVIADLQWPSSSILAHIHAQIISEELGCSTNVTTLDIESSTTTLKTAQTPTLMPELWVTRVAERWNQVVEARAGFVSGDSFGVANFEGWFVAQKLVQDFPILASVANLGDMAELYDLEGKPEFITCPQDWACSVLNENLLKAFGLWAVFDVVIPKDRLDMDRLIGAAISTNSPTVFYYWQPNALVHDLKLVPLNMGPHEPEAFACMGNKECADLKPTAFANEKVGIAVAEWVRGDAPELLPYARKAQMPMAIMNELLSVQVEGQLTSEQVATYFVVNYPQIWQGWLPIVSQ